MRIALVITNGPTKRGGLEHLALRLAQHLGEGSAANCIACRFTSGRQTLRGYFGQHEERRTFVCEGIPIRVMAPSWFGRFLLRPVFRLIWRKMTNPLARWLYLAAMTREVRRCCAGCDIIHYLGSANEMLGFAAWKAARLNGVPFVVEPAVHPGQWGDSWHDAMLYSMADLVLAHSRYEAQVIEQLGVARRKVFTVIHGVDPPRDGDGSRFRARYGIDGPMVLFLGRKTEEKGVFRCIEAFRRLAERVPSAFLVMAGPSGGITLNEPGDRMIDLSELSDSEKNDALAACDVLCVPSEGESFGMVYFEAWGFKKPVVALNLPILRETLGTTGGGILVEGVPEEISRVLETVLTSPDFALQLGSRGHEASLRHSWRNAAETYSVGYSLLGGAPGIRT